MDLIAPTLFRPTRAAALARLDAFAPQAGAAYAARRNLDLPGHPHVSRLSPHLRHRLITEDEVLATVLQHHAPHRADKFITEVFWRLYWKGWLEMRPGVWEAYRHGLAAALNNVRSQDRLRRDWAAACAGDTGIDAFDHWARELAATGYLHNHARMWFASIWIFTLRLPWELGADLFLRHLLDGDAASNTLSWRWVGGLQTIGKTYLARPDNIATYTEGRFHPRGLATTAPPLPPGAAPILYPLPRGDSWHPAPPLDLPGLLLTDEDLSPDWLLAQGLAPQATATLLTAAGRSPLTPAPAVTAWGRAAIRDTTTRLAARLGPVTHLPDAAPTTPGTSHAPPLAEALIAWAHDNRLTRIITAHPATGPAADTLATLAPALAAAGLPLLRVIRPLDAASWPHATAGFFRFRDAIPTLLGQVQGWRLL